MKRLIALAAAVVVVGFVVLSSSAADRPLHHHHHRRFLAPASFYPQALCVHDGWHYRRAWTKRDRRHAVYVFGPFRYVRTTKTWSNGEGAWDVVDPPYGGGMQFMLATWHRAGGSGSSVAAIARASPREQIYRAWRIVHADASWREWPNTSKACGLS